MTGRQRLLALDAGDAIEVVEDFIATAGAVTVELDGEKVTTELARDELLDLKPVSPPVVIDESLTPVGGVTGAPRALAPDFEWLTVIAMLGPPLPDDDVDVGDRWNASHLDPLIGMLSIEAEIIDEIATDDGGFLFLIEFSGSAVDLPVDLDLVDVLDLTGALPPQSLDGSLSGGSSAAISLRSATLDGLGDQAVRSN